MRTPIVLGFVVLAAPATATAQNAGVCVINGTEEAAFFVADASGAPQKAGMLQPGETLCSGQGDGSGGAVRVFEHADGFEGCSRLVAEGQSETLIRYVDFDRCHWSSHDN